MAARSDNADVVDLLLDHLDPDVHNKVSACHNTEPFFFLNDWTQANMDEFILSRLSIHLFLDLNLDQTFITYKGWSAMKQVCIWKPLQSEWREQLNST